VCNIAQTPLSTLVKLPHKQSSAQALLSSPVKLINRFESLLPGVVLLILKWDKTSTVGKYVPRFIGMDVITITKESIIVFNASRELKNRKREDWL
jgi:hypothetical protein